VLIDRGNEQDFSKEGEQVGQVQTTQMSAGARAVRSSASMDISAAKRIRHVEGTPSNSLVCFISLPTFCAFLPSRKDPNISFILTSAHNAAGVTMQSRSLRRKVRHSSSLKAKGWSDLLNMFDGDSDGFVTHEEFAEVCCKSLPSRPLLLHWFPDRSLPLVYLTLPLHNPTLPSPYLTFSLPNLALPYLT